MALAESAKSLLASVAEAMESASSVHMSGFGSEGDKDSPTGMKMDDKRFDIWVSPRFMAMCQANAEGKIVVAAGADLETNKVWGYSADDATRYVADITQQKEGVRAVLQGNMRMMVQGQFARGPRLPLKDGTTEETTEEREGRVIRVITVCGESKGISSGPGVAGDKVLRMRFVLEVDKETNHLLNMRQYAQAEGHPEVQVGCLDRIEYDVPAPSVQIPEAKESPATVEIKEDSKLLSMIVVAGDKHVWRSDVLK